MISPCPHVGVWLRGDLAVARPTVEQTPLPVNYLRPERFAAAQYSESV